MKIPEERLKTIKWFLSEEWIDWSNPSITHQRFTNALPLVHDPLDLLALVLFFDWEENRPLLGYILDHKQCDRGIALLVYWSCSPWIVYRKVEKGLALDMDMEARFKLIKHIESCFDLGMFTSAVFNIDPAKIFGKPIRDDYPNSPGMRFVPEYMRHPTLGIVVIPDELRDTIFSE